VERQELEDLLRERDVYNTLMMLRRQLERGRNPNPSKILQISIYNHDLNRYISDLGAVARNYELLVERGQIIKVGGNFAEYKEQSQTLSPRRKSLMGYDLALDAILKAINEAKAKI